jgi:hypothetical protein
MLHHQWMQKMMPVAAQPRMCTSVLTCARFMQVSL